MAGASKTDLGTCTDKEAATEVTAGKAGTISSYSMTLIPSLSSAQAVISSPLLVSVADKQIPTSPLDPVSLAEEVLERACDKFFGEIADLVLSEILPDDVQESALGEDFITDSSTVPPASKVVDLVVAEQAEQEGGSTAGRSSVEAITAVLTHGARSDSAISESQVAVDQLSVPASVARVRERAIGRMVKDFTSFLRESVCSVLDDGCPFSEFKPALLMYLGNTSSMTNADFAEPYHSQLRGTCVRGRRY